MQSKLFEILAALPRENFKQQSKYCDVPISADITYV